MKITTETITQIVEDLMASKTVVSLTEIKSHAKSKGFKILESNLRKELTIAANRNHWDWHTTKTGEKEYFMPEGDKEFGMIKSEITRAKLHSSGHTLQVISLNRQPLPGDWEVNSKDTNTLYFDGGYTRDIVRTAYAKIMQVDHNDTRSKRF